MALERFIIADVYFAKSENGPIKIGISSDVPTRLAQLQSGMREMIDLLATVPGDRRVEAYFHRLFRRHRIVGEWFRPCAEIDAVIEDVKRRQMQAIPPEYRPMPEYDANPTAQDEIMSACRAYMEIIAGEPIRGETITQLMFRLSGYTGLSKRKLKSIWYFEDGSLISAREYMYLRDLAEAKQAEIVFIREAVEAANAGFSGYRLNAMHGDEQ